MRVRGRCQALLRKPACICPSCLSWARPTSPPPSTSAHAGAAEETGGGDGAEERDGDCAGGVGMAEAVTGAQQRQLRRALSRARRGGSEASAGSARMSPSPRGVSSSLNGEGRGATWYVDLEVDASDRQDGEGASPHCRRRSLASPCWNLVRRWPSLRTRLRERRAFALPPNRLPCAHFREDCGVSRLQPWRRVAQVQRPPSTNYPTGRRRDPAAAA